MKPIIERVHPSLLEQEETGEALVIEGLRKVYNKQIAVNGFHIKFY